MPTSEEEVIEKVTKYLTSVKSENTRVGARQIVEFLIKKWDEPGSEGWTRSGEIFNALRDHITNPNTLTRILMNLVKAEIIDRQPCPRMKGRSGKAPVFYRVPEKYSPLLFCSRDELIKQLLDLKDRMTLYKGAVAWELRSHPDIHEKIKDSFKVRLEKNKEAEVFYEKMSAWVRLNPCPGLYDKSL